MDFIKIIRNTSNFTNNNKNIRYPKEENTGSKQYTHFEINY